MYIKGFSGFCLIWSFSSFDMVYRIVLSDNIISFELVNSTFDMVLTYQI